MENNKNISIDIEEFKKKLSDVTDFSNDLKLLISELKDWHNDLLQDCHDIFDLENLNSINDELEKIYSQINHIINKLTLLEIKIKALIDTDDKDKMNRYYDEIKQLQEYIHQRIKDE